MKAAVYARMSTDKQSEASPEDQVAECRRYAKEQGLAVPDELVFIDRAMSGATTARPAYQAMRRALGAGAFQVLLAFDGSRIARNERDFFELLDELEAQGIKGVSVSTRKPLDEISERFMSVVSAHDRRRIATATRRGLKARAQRGRATGGPAFGYVTVAAEGGEKRLAVDAERAGVVVSIFERFVAGQGLKSIAHVLRLLSADWPRERDHPMPSGWRIAWEILGPWRSSLLGFELALGLAAMVMRRLEPARRS